MILKRITADNLYGFFVVVLFLLNLKVISVFSLNGSYVYLSFFN